MGSFIVGISGGSGAGKTTLAKKFLSHFNSAKYIAFDSYYKNLNQIPLTDGLKNFDSPFSYDMPLFYEHLKDLRMGKTIYIPQYDYESHKRKEILSKIESVGLIVIDGLLIYYDSILSSMFDLKIYIDTPLEIRVNRRILRDSTQMNLCTHDILKQINLTVLPMHNKFIENEKKYADYIISGTEPFNTANKNFYDLVNRLENQMSSEN